jgi:hypothetical protein
MNLHLLFVKFSLGTFLIFVTCIHAVVYASDFPLKEDVESIDGILNAYYDTVSGPKGYRYNAKRDRSLHASNVIVTRITDEGALLRRPFSEEQQDLIEPWKEGFYEVEINRIVEQYGPVAHVFSTFEMRSTKDGLAFKRGINSISLFHDDGRWWIASWSTINETEKALPEKYLPIPKK